jgi:2',3'-cyclic-nucleotide 2'-phosphodiesterase (5'-nucleotidase family)
MAREAQHGLARRAVACAALAAVTALSSTASAQHIQTIARVFATSEVEGRFAQAVCYRDDLVRESTHAGFTYALARAAEAPDEPMILDAGNLLTPHGVTRFAAENDPAGLAEMIAAVGYRALALGLNDLAADRAAMLSVIRELNTLEVAMIASNLRCDADAEALCGQVVDAADPPSMHVVNGRDVAVLAVLRPEVLSLITPERARGLRLEPPKETIERFTREAREQGAQIVIAVVDAEIEGGPAQLATELSPASRPDLFILSSGSELLFARPQSLQPVLVGTPEGDAVEVLIRESDEIRDGFEFLAQPLEGRGITAARPVLDWIAGIADEYCRAWGRPLDGARLDEPIDLAGMHRLSAGIVRAAASADVAVLNRRALDTHWRAGHDGALTASDVYVALEYDEPIQVADVDAAWLTELARRARSSGQLVTPGLTFDGASIEIDGHPAEARARYRVATIRYLAAGGDDALPPLTHGERWESLGDATLRSVVLRYLERERAQDPRAALPDPEGTIEWLFRGSADLTFSGSAVDNPPRRCDARTPPERCRDGYVVDALGARRGAFDTSLLNRSDTLTFGLTIDLAADAAAPDWTWQNSANALYRTAWVQGTGGRAGVFAEAADQIRGRSALAWRGLRQGRDQWYIPDPTVDLFIESEFTEPAERSWHWFLVRPTAGVRFQLFDRLQLQLLAGFQFQPFDPQMEVEAGVGATLALTPWDFLRYEDRFARVAFAFDYFLAGLGDDNRSQLRAQLDAGFDLAGPLALVLSVRLYVQGEDDQDIGAAIDATAGLRLGYFGRATGP